MNYMLWILLFFATKSTFLEGFNIDLKSVKSFSGRTGEYFGYSLTFHSNDQGKWLVVGAPFSSLGETDSSLKPGNVFKCPLDGSSSCDRIVIDKPKVDEIRKSQWLGNNVLSGGNKSTVITCAPRFRDLSISGGRMHGRCTALDGKTFSVLNQLNICGKFVDKQVAYGVCHAGISAALSDSAPTILAMGLPTVNKRGSLAKVNVADLINGSNAAQLTGIDKVSSGDELGYSVTLGAISDSPGGEVIGGAPTGSNRKGKVNIYKVGSLSKVSIMLESPEDQMGTYFGGAVKAIDLNDDGKCELLVGAPHYSVNYEEGKVYLYKNDGKGNLDLVTTHLHPDQRPGARFGTSIESIGDINGDGFLDFAIGAPYGGSSGNGAVYIYHGGPDVIKNSLKPMQVIQASAVNNNLKGFGISIAGEMDVDDNGYPDLAVGSFVSDHVNVFRSRGVLKLIGTIMPDKALVSTTLNTSFCVGPDMKTYACNSLRICLIYSGKTVPPYIDSSVSLTLDKHQIGGKRAFFFAATNIKETTRSLTMSLKAGEKQCISLPFYVIVNYLDDAVSPIVISMDYSYITPDSCGKMLCPVMDKYLTNSKSAQLSYVKDCGEDFICSPDLVVNASYALTSNHSDKEFFFGAQDTLVITTAVRNKGENAFTPKLYVDYPQDFQFIGIDSFQRYVIWDIGRKENRITLSLGTVLRHAETMILKIKFSPKGARPTVQLQKFRILAFASGKELDPSNNKVTLQFNAAFLTDVTILGTAFPDTVYFRQNASNEKYISVNDIGPEVKLVYLVQNLGPGPVEKFKVLIKVVSHVGKENVLYVVDVNADGRLCSGDINPSNLTAQDQKNTNKATTRRRRSVSDIKVVKRLDCRTALCSLFTCGIDHLPAPGFSKIQVTARLWENTFRKRGKEDVDVLVEARIAFSQTELKFLRQPKHGQPDVKEITLSVKPLFLKKTSAKKSIPWWIILLAVLGGVLFLVIAVIVLYKKGFFKRKNEFKEISSPVDDEY